MRIIDEEYDEIQELLEKYYDGKTTDEENKRVDEHLEKLRFISFDELSDIEMEIVIEKEKEND